jgi:hypothetical protein
LILGTAGCVARATTRAAVVVDEPVVTVETVPIAVETVPVEVEAYPSYYYGGTYVYLVDGRWYTRASGRWVIYRREPVVLARARVHLEAQSGRHYRPHPEMASPTVRSHRRGKGHDR